MTKRTIGVGVIGLGWMGRLHSRSYRKLQEYYPDLGVDIQLVAAADPLESNRDAAVSQLGFERVYSDYKDLLSDPAIDVVSICCPNFLHRDVAVATAQAGKPFWIEKPMGVSAAQSQEISAAAQRHNVVTAVGFNYRHTPAIEKARQLIHEGKLGRITNARCWLIADYASSPTGPLTWRYKSSNGPVVWTMMGEMFPARVRGAANGAAVFILWVMNAIVAISFPPMMANLGGAWTYGIYSAINLVFAFVLIKIMPETSGKSLEQIETEMEERFS